MEVPVRVNPFKIAAGFTLLATVAVFSSMAPQLYRYLRIRRM